MALAIPCNHLCAANLGHIQQKARANATWTYLSVLATVIDIGLYSVRVSFDALLSLKSVIKAPQSTSQPVQCNTRVTQPLKHLLNLILFHLQHQPARHI